MARQIQLTAGVRRRPDRSIPECEMADARNAALTHLVSASAFNAEVSRSRPVLIDGEQFNSYKQIPLVN